MKPKRSERLLTIAAGGSALVGAGALLGLHSAVAVVVDAPAVAMVASALALALATGARMLAAHRGRARRWHTLLAAVGVCLLLGAVFDRLRYERRDVRFAHDGVSLAGTLYVPRGDGPWPGVVLVHGSGPHTRAEYEYWAHRFAEHGIAALAYDKRGVGESDGELWASDYFDFAADARAAVGPLRERPGVDPARIGVLGFSEGEWVAPLAASRSPEIAFVAVVGASGTTPAEQVQAEIRLRLERGGYSEADIGRALDLNAAVFAYQRTGNEGEALSKQLSQAAAEPWFAAAQDIPAEIAPVEEYAWWRSVMDFSAPWREVGVPVLLLKGGEDDRSPPEPMIERVSNALAEGGHAPPVVVVYPTADHMLLEWPLGRGVPPPQFAPGVFEQLADWISQV